ncbi:MAG TPA: zinc ribbon domain-containing protein [Bryobacteraceae bacterium]|nr:zinc ribbon domain-containing protein [Bryobacteraceae bacterium]
MPDFCTCGAQLPPDARFCHKCGKPQYDYPGFEPDPVQPPPLPTPAAAPPSEISFHNRLAVRIGFLVALTAFLPFMILQAIPFLPAVIAFLTGFLAVYSYSRFSGQSLSVRSGARLGWITGIFSFGIIALLITMSTIFVVTQGKAVVERVKEYQGGSLLHFNNDQIEAMTKLVQDPAMFATEMVGLLLLLFVMLTALPVLGGALGAKVFAKE